MQRLADIAEEEDQRVNLDDEDDQEIGGEVELIEDQDPDGQHQDGQNQDGH